METKYHRVYAKIDLDAIEQNLLAIRKHVHRECASNEVIQVMAVIKADGYGHGAIPIGRELEKLGIDYIAVAIYQEGIALRKEGIKTPILVLGDTPKEAYHQLLEYQLTQSVHSLTMAREIAQVAKLQNKVVKIHVKIDTGMGRIGIRAIKVPLASVVSQFEEMRDLNFLEVEGVFTHFSKADEVDKSYTNQQITIFNQLLEALEGKGILPKLIHASNSAGLIDVKKAHYNMVRAGIALYGLYPSDEVDHSIHLKPALSIISHIVFLKEVEEGELISYGGIYQTTKATKIATIPIGYADGYSRALSNKGRVVIRGAYAPVIGRVCMDQIMVDVSDIPKVEIGDEVYLIGGVNDQVVSVEELAQHMNTINYEVICLIGKRVPRVYMKNDEMVDSIDYFY